MARVNSNQHSDNALKTGISWQSKRGAAIGPPQVTCGMRTKGGPGFVQLYRFIKRSQAWHELSLPARCALIELLDRYNGINNGMIGPACEG